MELPADFVRMRDSSRVRALNEVCSFGLESEPEDANESDVADSIATQNSVASAPASSIRSDGLLVDDETVDAILAKVVKSAQESLSSEFISTADESIVGKKTPELTPKSTRQQEKRESEIAALRSAVTNAINNGSCPAEKISIVDKEANRPPVQPESPPDAPRVPQDRRKRLRSGCFRYVCRAEVPNNLQTLKTELKLISPDLEIGLGLTEIFSALESHPDRPLEDTWSGVSHKIKH